MAPAAVSDQKSSAEGAQTAPTQMSAGSRANEQETLLGPPEAKKARLDTKPTVATLHPVSELVQKYQGAMFVCTGMASLMSWGHVCSITTHVCVCVCLFHTEGGNLELPTPNLKFPPPPQALLTSAITHITFPSQEHHVPCLAISKS